MKSRISSLPSLRQIPHSQLRTPKPSRPRLAPIPKLSHNLNKFSRRFKEPFTAPESIANLSIEAGFKFVHSLTKESEAHLKINFPDTLIVETEAFWIFTNEHSELEITK